MKRKSYPKYKPSGVEWLGEVPEHWDMKRLKYQSSINDEALPETNDPEYELLYVDISSVDPVQGIIQKEPMIFENAPSRARRIVKNGDTIVSTVRTYLRAISPVKNPEPNLIVSTGFAVVRPDGVESDYLSSVIRAPYFIEEVVSRSVGVSYPAINASEIGLISIPVPPFPEQQAIATFLDRETNRIDELINKKQKLVELLKEKRTALISRAVTKGLNLNVKMKDSGVDGSTSLTASWLGEVPEHWGKVLLKWASVRYSGGTPDKTIQEYWENGTIPWLNSGAVNDGYITEPSEYITEKAFRNSSAKWIPKDALVIALAGQGKTKGMVAQIGFKTTCNQSMAAIIPDKRINARMLYWWFTNNYYNLRNLAGGDARDGLNLEMIGSIQCPLPPLYEQQFIVNFLDRETSKIDTLFVKVEEVIEKLKEYRTALISAAVTGKIDVRVEGNTPE